LFLTLLTRVLSGQQNHLVRRICCKAGNSRCPSPAELVAIATQKPDNRACRWRHPGMSAKTCRRANRGVNKRDREVQIMLEYLEQQKKFTINQWKIFAAATIGDMLDFFDFLLIAFILAFIVKDWNLTYGILGKKPAFGDATYATRVGRAQWPTRR
jgi:hypothetical protein